MQVIPAIDIREGRCVRLYQGDYGRETVYSEQPLRMAQRWVDLGASRLHVVDLDGARRGALANLDVVTSITSSCQAAVQMGGGIRTVETAKEVVSAGIDRVIIGTAAVEDPKLIEALYGEVGPELLVVSVDARDGYVAVRGWTENTRILASDLVQRMADTGVRRFMYTDVVRDGTLTEPNFDAIEALTTGSDLPIMAAGGISSVEHIVRLSRIGVEAAIIGTALYTGHIDLREAIAAVGDGS